MNKIYAEIGTRILELRRTLKLTQAQVAERAGIDSSFFGQVERGKNIPSLKTFLAIASALHADPADLLSSSRNRKHTGRNTYQQVVEAMISDLTPNKRRFVLGILRDIASEFNKK